jgi:hypothetical protein
MNVKQHIPADTGKAVGGRHLLRPNREADLVSIDPAKLTEERIEQISLRATIVGPVLEAILQEQHGYSRWGLNE